jgi:hypothetical protein
MSTVADNIQARPQRKAPKYAALFDAYDQGQVRADLAAFFGPNADVYLATYEKMRAAQPNRRTSVRTWSWPVFLGSFTWFFYRKMHTYGAMVILLPLVLGYLFGGVGGGMFVIFAISAKNWYVVHALGRICKADELGLAGAERADYLQRAGGVSLPAGIFAGLIYGLGLLLLTLALLLHHKTGHA